MHDLHSLLKGYPALPQKEKKERLATVLLQKNLVNSLFGFLSNPAESIEIQRSTLHVLCDIANKDAFKKKIFNALTPDAAGSLLASADPKVRKNAAKLLGIANRKTNAPVLIDALAHEQTEYVIESLILALGYTDYSKKAYDYLSAYTPRATEEKHRTAEENARRKALSSLRKAEPIDDICLNGRPLLLTYPAETPNALKSELNALKIAYNESKHLSHALEVHLENYIEAFASRCFFEALVDLGQYNRDESYTFLHEILKNIGQLLPKESDQLRFDLRYLNPAEKQKTMTELVEKLKDTKFSSSPSNYQFELRLCFKKTSVTALLSVPSLDNRFAYRKETIPASIHPVIAANMMRTILPFLSPDATVLDPFCGSGTLLYERDFILPCEELIGVDIKKDAVYKAKVNFLNERIPVGFLVSDILTADLDQTFDEIIANMPFGRRVSDTKNNEALYADFIKRLKTLLKIKGYAFLYTNQKTLLKTLIGGDMKFELVDEILFEAGGLFPSLFIIKRIR